MNESIRIFKIGSRVATRGLVGQLTGTVTKIGRLRATVELDPEFHITHDSTGRRQRTNHSHAFEYKHLRLISEPIQAAVPTAEELCTAFLSTSESK